jgi:hypothetical protein
LFLVLCLYRGAFLKLTKSLFVALASALFSTAVLADGIDPKVIIEPGGGGSTTPITLTNPNPTVTAPAVANTGQCTDPAAPACVFDGFQNQAGTTITTLTIFIPTLGSLIFSCGDASTLIFDFNACNSSNVIGGTDITFSNSSGSPFSGAPTSGEFAVDIEGAGVGIGTVIPVTAITTPAITTPEPGTALLMVFGALAFGLLALGRRLA